MLADDFEPWSAKKTSILSRYTTSEKISITTVSTPGCELSPACVCAVTASFVPLMYFWSSQTKMLKYLVCFPDRIYVSETCGPSVVQYCVP